MKKISSLLFLVVLGFLLFYLFLPVLRFGFGGFAIILLLLFVIGLILALGLKSDGKKKNYCSV